jgi:hypothetical protein
MSTNLESAKQFFEACETGKGWEGCNAFCHPEATFSSQTTVLTDVTTLEGYCFGSCFWSFPRDPDRAWRAGAADWQ